jgi:hypothetical protein
MVDDQGHQVAMIEYPGLPRDYVMEMVHKFYDEYYFRPKQVFRIVRKAIFNNVERKRLYKEARDFMKLRSMRNKAVKVARDQQTKLKHNPPAAPSATTKEAQEETVNV